MDQTQPSPRIRIFRPGTFTSNEGLTLSFSQADLEGAAAAYDAASDPAPLVIGHPELNDPAWGWVGKLSVEGDELVAEAEDIEPSFAEAVRAKRYRKVSAQFYPPQHPANPKPGAWYLKHVGFLGAKAPAVKGLGTVAFADGADANVITIDLPTHQEKTMSDIKDKDQAASFAEREKTIAQREEAVAAREKKAAEDAREARHKANVSFAEAMVDATKLAPAGKPIVVGLLDTLDATAVVSFSEAGEMTPADAMRKLLDGAAPLVSLGEFGAKPKEATALVSFAAPQGYSVDPEDAAAYAKAKSIQAENPNLGWMDCVARAQAS